MYKLIMIRIYLYVSNIESYPSTKFATIYRIGLKIIILDSFSVVSAEID